MTLKANYKVLSVVTTEYPYACVSLCLSVCMSLCLCVRFYVCPGEDCFTVLVLNVGFTFCVKYQITFCAEKRFTFGVYLTLTFGAERNLAVGTDWQESSAHGIWWGWRGGLFLAKGKGGLE